MAILREYRCPTHGEFESRFSICPQGCVDVERIHTRPPAAVSRRTRNIDRTLEGMAKDYKLSDISNRKGTLAASVAQFQPQPLPDVHPEMVTQYMAKQQQFYGGKFERGADGSWWASGTNYQQGKATATGEHMKTIVGYEAPQVKTRPIVQGSYGTSADVAAAARKA